jgi:putative glycosyltransferase (TIGR04372 family)
VLRNIRILLSTASLMSYARLNIAIRHKFGVSFSRFFQFAIGRISIFLPYFLIPYAPAWFSSICSSYALQFSSNKRRFYTWISNLEGISKYAKVALHRKAYFLFREGDMSALRLLLDSRPNDSSLNLFVNEWIYFNLNQEQYISHLEKEKSRLMSVDSEQLSSGVRYLPDHTKHMGHLGFLFLYNMYYSKSDPHRKVAIWPHLAPNSFYMKKLIENFRLNLVIMPKDTLGKAIPEIEKDTIMMSRQDKSIWRFEPLVAGGTGQDFPEFNVEESDLLKPDISTHELSLEELRSIGFNPKLWFVVLHVKEDKLGYQISGETRDASVLDYQSACCAVRDLGGQVVRMGGTNFPKLPRSFPAIDYAHSGIRKDYIDYWLWANCSYWIGNCNGASVAVIPFGKPRLLTNQWPLDPNGPSKDLVLPKLLFSKSQNRYLPFRDIVRHPFGRNMSRSLLSRSGLSLVDNPPEVITTSLLELVNRTDAPQNSLNHDETNLALYSATKTFSNTPRMSMSEHFVDFYTNLLD